MDTKAAANSRSVDTQVDDGALEVRVSSALSKDEQIKKEARTNVMTYQGRVLLVGRSPNAKLSTRVKQIITGIGDANEVYSETRQGQPIGLGEAPDNAWIAAEVRLRLLTSDLVESSDVKVITENGEVLPIGLATEREAEVTVDITSRVSGVKRVTTVFTFIKQQPL